MSMINKEVSDFSVQAYQNGELCNVMSVPCLVINQDKVSFGKKNIQQLLELF